MATLLWPPTFVHMLREPSSTMMADEGVACGGGACWLCALTPVAQRRAMGASKRPSPNPRFPPMAYIPVGPPSRYTLFGSPHTLAKIGHD